MSTTTDKKAMTAAGRWMRKAPAALLSAGLGLAQVQTALAQIVNDVTVTGSFHGQTIQSSARATVTVTRATPQLMLLKTGALDDGGDGVADVGDAISYSFTVTNTGNVTLTNVSLADPLVPVTGGPIAALAPGASDAASFTASYRLTAADIAAGFVHNTATATASKPDGTALNASDDDRLALATAGGLSLVKTAALYDGGDGKADAGDIVAYSFTVTNTGNTPLNNVTVSDPLLDAAAAAITPASVATLAPDEQAVFTASYALTQADVDAGRVDNTATAHGQNDIGRDFAAAGSAGLAYAVHPSVALVKTAQVDFGADGEASVGDIITYRFTVTNTGNVTLANVTVTDPLVTVLGGPLPNLAPGQSDSTAFTASYALTQNDLNAGQVVNQATATGEPPSGEPVTDLSDGSSITGDTPTVTPLAAAPRIALVKQAAPVTDVNGNGRTDAGDILNYRFTVTNTGNVTLTDVVVTDPLVTVSGGPLASLAVAASDSATFSASYEITQADIDRGGITNQATAMARDPAGNDVTDLSDGSATTGDTPTVTPIDESPAIALVKQVRSVADRNGNGLNDAGDVINYRFAVTNTGNVTLTGVAVTDPLVTVSGGPLATLAPGAIDTRTFTASYTVTEADMAAGRVTNQARAEGRSPAGAAVSDLSDSLSLEGDNPTVTALVADPAIAVIKSVRDIVNTNGNGLVDAGDVIRYGFTVVNTGNVTLSEVIVTDPLVAVDGEPIPSLVAGATDSATFTASYTITEADVAAGRVVNQATATGTGPADTAVTDLSDESSLTGDDPTVTPLANSPSIALVKRVTAIDDVNGNYVTDPGDVIRYAFEVTNTGNVALTAVTVTDPLVTVDGGPLATLGVAQTDSATFTAAYTITAADADRGGVTNQATATGLTSGGVVVSDVSDAASIDGDQPTVTPVASAPGIALIKTVASTEDRNGNGVTDAGDVLVYAFAITNTGNVTLANITVSDPLVEVTGGPLPSLAAGATDSATFKARYTITASDSAAGEVRNQAMVSGRTPDGGAITDLSDDDAIDGNDPTVTPVQRNGLKFTKVALDDEIRRGERVAFEIAASNAGTAPLRIVDIMPPGFAYVAGSATANGAAVAPVVKDRKLVFGDLTPDGGGAIKLKLTLLASTSLSTGRHINQAQLVDPATGAVIATAQAAVTIVEEHVFDCGEIIGRVFDDLNRNGYADDGEPGLPAVRVATVKGLLVTTDKKGRFHVPCADIPDAATGSNFLMKLDIRTLPTGYYVTTENPRDVRLTRGKITKLNFGASIMREVVLDLEDAAFLAGGTALKPEWNKGLGNLMAVLEQEPSVLKIRLKHQPDGKKLADKRLAAVKKLIEVNWKKQGGQYRLLISTQARSAE